MAYEELIDRMSAHMGKADIADVLPDLHAGADAITSLLSDLEAMQALADAYRAAINHLVSTGKPS